MSTALERLTSYYNGSVYNVSTNPGGFLQGGHLVNFHPALQDVATVASGVASNATAAAGSASAAAASASAASSSAAALNGTSATSIAIATGSVGPFTTQSGKQFDGVWVNVRSAANPTVNYMNGLASYSGTSLTIAVPSNGSAGSGTFSDWIISVAGKPGNTGPTGATGSIGVSPAIQWNFSNGTTDSDPGNGLVKFNNAVTSAITVIYFDNLDYITSNAPSAIPFTNASALAIDFSPTSDKGLDGTGAGDMISDETSAADGEIFVAAGTGGKHFRKAGVGIGTSGNNLTKANAANTWALAQTSQSHRCLPMQRDRVSPWAQLESSRHSGLHHRGRIRRRLACFTPCLMCRRLAALVGASQELSAWRLAPVVVRPAGAPCQCEVQRRSALHRRSP